MLYLKFLLVFCTTGCVTSRNVGSTLFYNLQAKSGCWNEDDIAKLRARKSFDELLTPQVNPNRVNTKFIKDTIKYFRNALKYVELNTDPRTAAILRDALSDTIGGNLRREILPTVRFAYYAGYVSYRNARQLHNFYDEIKARLNTQGLGWKQPPRIPQWTNLTVGKIMIGTGKLLNPCACLVTKRDSNSCIHLPSPKLDDYESPSAIALPFKTDGLVSLAAPSAENILLKYYTTASRCILHSSPSNCRHSDFVNFNSGMWHWMKHDVAPHLVDEKLYAAYGGVLRIAAAVQNYGKGLSRRNLFETDDVAVKWMPWRAFTDTYFYIDREWTTKLYICIVLAAALAICLLQICYNYMFGDASNCRCTGEWRKSSKVANAEIETKSPLIMTHQSAVYFNEKKRSKNNTPSKTKSTSLGSVRTQKVYDLNENTEKLMAVIMSDNEDSDSSQSKIDSINEASEKHMIDVGNESRPKSPPKIETSMAQLKLNKSISSNKQTLPMYSTSTLTCSDATYCQGHQVSESAWSGTGSSTSGRSCSSTSSKSQSRQSRSSRDLAWARHVIAKSTQSTKSTTGTDLNINSFIKTPSNR